MVKGTIYQNILKLILKYPSAILILLIVLTIIMSLIASGVVLDLGMYTLLPEDDMDFQAFKEVSKEFGGFDNLIIVLEGNDYEKLEEVSEEIAARMRNLKEIVRDVDYKFPYKFIKEHFLLYISEENFNKIMGIFIDNPELISAIDGDNNLLEILSQMQDKESLERIMNFINEISIDGKLDEDSLESLLYSIDDELIDTIKEIYYFNNDKTKLLVFLRPTNPNHDMRYFEKMVSGVEAELERIMSDIEGVTYNLAGMAKMMEEQQAFLNKRIVGASIAALIMIIILFMLFFKRVLAPILASLPIIIALIWTLGINQLVIGRLNLVTSIFAAILLGLGIDFSIHFITKFFYEMEQGKDYLESLTAVYVHTVPGIITGGLTTAISFYMLMISKFKGLYELGFIAGTGILMCLASVLIMLPCLISKLYNKRVIGYKKNYSYKIYAKYSYFLTKHKKKVAIGVFLLMGLSFTSGLTIKFNYNSLELLPQIPSVKIQKNLSKEFNNSFEYSILKADDIGQARRQYKEIVKTDIYSLIDSPVIYIPEDQNSRIEKIKDIQARLGQPLVGLNTNNYQNEIDESLRDIKDIEILNYNLKYIVNEVKVGMANVLDTGEITLDKLPNELKNKFIGEDGSIGTFIFGKRDMWEEEPMKETVTELKNIDMAVSGTPFIWVRIVDYLQSDLIKSTIAVLVALMLVLYIDFKNLKTVLITMVPIALGAIWLLGILSLMDIKLNAANIAAFPLIVGIGIDDGIHMLHSYKANGRREIMPMIVQSGKAVLITSLTSMIGFGVLYFVKDPLVSSLGLLLFLGVLFCLIISLTVLPILLIKFGGQLINEEEIK